MGAQNARTLVKNQWRTKTTSSVFLVRIHVWLTIAPAMMAVCSRDECARSEKVVSRCSRGCRGSRMFIVDYSGPTASLLTLGPRTEGIKQETEESGSSKTNETCHQLVEANPSPISPRGTESRREEDVLSKALDTPHPCRFTRVMILIG